MLPLLLASTLLSPIAQRDPDVRSALDLAVLGLPLEGQPLAVEVRGPAATSFLVSVDLLPAQPSSPDLPSGALPGTRAARAAAGALHLFVLEGTTDDAGLWRTTFDAPRAGSALVLRGFEAAREFEALELDILPPYAARAGDVSIASASLGADGHTHVALVNHTDFVLALGDWTLADERGAIEVLDRDLHLTARGTTHVATDALGGSLALVSGDGLEIGRVGLTSPGVSFGATPIGSPTHGMTKCALHEDVPDLGFADTNCDGIDGDIDRAVFVSTTGSALNPGTPEAPLNSVNAAIQLAASDPLKDHVYVSEGSYAGLVTLLDGVSVWGGYSQANGWARSGAFVTTFSAGGTVAGNRIGVRGANLATPVTLGSVTVTTTTAPTNGHNYGILLQQSDDVTLEAVTVVAGNGGSAQAGSPGSNGSAGSAGSSTIGNSGAPGGGGAHGGGAGGNGGNLSPFGFDGSNGGGPLGGGGGGGGGLGNNGGGGNSGGVGATGSAGAPGSNVGTVVAGLWVSNGDGSTAGTGGSGSGGGGGGGGGIGGFLFGFQGGGGGGGGGSGFGATGGTGGRAGGSSFALFLSASDASIQSCSLTAGAGRNGGNGGAGGTGGSGGSGGSGATPSNSTHGGNGGAGGRGGHGGIGGGGGGGHSYAIVVDALSDASLSSSTLSTSTAGAGGTGGNNGLAGEAALIKQL